MSRQPPVAASAGDPRSAHEQPIHDRPEPQAQGPTPQGSAGAHHERTEGEGDLTMTRDGVHSSRLLPVRRHNHGRLRGPSRHPTEGAVNLLAQ